MPTTFLPVVFTIRSICSFSWSNAAPGAKWSLGASLQGGRKRVREWQHIEFGFGGDVHGACRRNALGQTRS